MKANGKGSSGEAPRLPKDVARWFVGEVRKEIEAVQREGNPYYGITPSEVDRLADRLRAEDPRFFFEWENGGWVFAVDIFAFALKHFADELHAGITVDDFLRADMAGTLEYSGAQGGTSALSDAQWYSLAEAADARRHNWPTSR